MLLVDTVNMVRLEVLSGPMKTCFDLSAAAAAVVVLAAITFLCGAKDPVTRRVDVQFRRSTFLYSRDSPCRLRRRVQCGARLGSMGTRAPGNVLPDVVYTTC